MPGWFDLAERDDWPDDPFDLLADWLPANDDPARPIMTVVTATADGEPDGRIQLLSEWDRDGFTWHTDSRSRKLTQLADNPRVALVLFWPEVGHQITVQGVAEELTAAELAGAYAARSPYLRELAWLNTDEFAALPLAERLARWAAFAAEHGHALQSGGDLTAPPTWAGRRVRPTRLTFWAGRPDSASRRIEYRRAGDAGSGAGSAWEARVLAG